VKVLRHEFGRFVIGGVVNTTITYAAYLMMELVMSPSVAYTLVYVFGICLSYLINTYFVFHAKGTVRSGLRYPLVYGAQYLIGLTALTLLTHFGMDSRIAMILVIVINLPVTFLLTRFVLKQSR
jgi:putative flippase GtrA